MASGLRRWPPVRLAIALLVAGAVATVVLGCSGTHARGTVAHVSTAARVRGDAVGVTAAIVGRPIPTGFVGMSIELKALEQYTGTNPAAIDPAFVRLLQDIAPEQTPVLRVGGDSTDWSWWPTPHTRRPGGVRYTLTPNWMRVARALDAELHAKMILGVNLEADNRAVAAAEAHAMVDQIGAGNIEALELGNEPELYGTFSWYRSTTGKLIHGRPRDYDERDFISDYSSVAPTLPDVPLAGPSSGAPEWLAQLGAFLSDEPRVRLATVHAYPLKHCTKSKVVTSGELLADTSSHGLAELIAPLVAVAAAHHVPLRIDELNGISCGGTRGVSDTFTSALWVLDTLFELARIGVGGVNIHTVPGAINEILGPQLARGTWQVRVHPEFYGMVMFAQAAPPGSHLLRVSSKVPPGVKVWATRTPSGVIHVIVINKRLRGPATLSLRVASAHGVASAEQLLAPGVHATGGVTLGGQSFGSATTTGALAGAPTRIAISPSGGAYGVRLPAASATMLTLPAR